MNEEELIKAIDSLMKSYDAYYFQNKYSEESNTHKKEFDLLIEYFKDDEMSIKAIEWIKNKYDCFYQNEFENDKNSAFAYLKNKLGVYKMNEEEKYKREKRHKKGKLYKNKLRKIFKEEVYLLQAMAPELMNPVEYFQIIIGNKVYYISYVPIEQVKFKDMLRQIYESYWYDIFEKYINIDEITKYLQIRKEE